MGHSRPLFLYIRLFNTVDSKQMLDKSLPMPGFEPRISSVEGDRSTTEPQPLPKMHNMIFISDCATTIFWLAKIKSLTQLT